MHRTVTAPDRYARELDRRTLAGVVPDVADPDVAVAARGERLGVGRVVGPVGDTDRVAGPVDGEDPSGVARVVGRDEQPVVDHERTRLDDRWVLEGEHLVPLGRGRRSGDPRGEGCGDDESGKKVMHPVPGHARWSSSPRRGRTPQASTSSSYSRRTEPPLTGRPVRTPRSRVL